MLNQSGIKKTSAVTRKVVLIAPELAFSLGCKVANTGVEAGENGKKIVKAGTPLVGNIEARDTAFTVASADSTPCGILLHDVDVSEGNANAQVVIFGFVDSSKLEDSVTEMLTTEMKAKLPKITFVK